MAVDGLWEPGTGFLCHKTLCFLCWHKVLLKHHRPPKSHLCRSLVPSGKPSTLILGREHLKNENELLPSHQKPPSNTHTCPHLVSNYFQRTKDSSAQKSHPSFSSQVPCAIQPKGVTGRAGVGTAVNTQDALRCNATAKRWMLPLPVLQPRIRSCGTNSPADSKEIRWISANSLSLIAGIFCWSQSQESTSSLLLIYISLFVTLSKSLSVEFLVWRAILQLFQVLG